MTAVTHPQAAVEEVPLQKGEGEGGGAEWALVGRSTVAARQGSSARRRPAAWFGLSACLALMLLPSRDS